MAVMQVLVYAGAIMVLVVFVIMLLNLGSEESLSEKMTTRQSLGIFFSMLFGAALIWGIFRSSHPKALANASSINNGTIEAVGKALFTTYVFPFEMISLVLLAAAVGAVVLTKRHLQA
jgi:NADH-quinone oxidoreductase subunit J